MADDSLKATDEQLAVDNAGFLTSDDIRTGFVSGITFANKAVQYAAVNNRAVFEGDIILGSVDEMERRTALTRTGATGDEEGIARGVAITGEQYRWPNARMPYEVDGAFPNKQRVTDAVTHWETNTNMRFVERTAANAAQYPNYVHVFAGDGCWSYVGMRGGRQDLSLAGGCGFGAAVHEFGHAWGLWHEQSREDRDTYVTINWGNITTGRESNFNQHITTGDDLAGYDYGSIMHYGMYAFSKNGLPTIVPKQTGVTIGQRNGLSQGDIDAVHYIYRTWHYSQTVSMVYAHHTEATGYVSLTGIGWRKIDPAAPSGVTNLLAMFAAAKANGRPVHVLMDGTTVYRAYAN